MSSSERSQIVDLVRRFTDAFNRDDLDDVMSFFTEEALYGEFNGKRNRGKAEIRRAFEPQFQGAFGQIRFHEEDLFVDEQEGKALIRWRCTIELDGRPAAWDGLDILHFEDALIKEKHTYAKADMPKLADI
jgi:ketosteroid isomerase-like protein